MRIKIFELSNSILLKKTANLDRKGTRGLPCTWPTQVQFPLLHMVHWLLTGVIPCTEIRQNLSTGEKNKGLKNKNCQSKVYDPSSKCRCILKGFFFKNQAVFYNMDSANIYIYYISAYIYMYIYISAWPVFKKVIDTEWSISYALLNDSQQSGNKSQQQQAKKSSTQLILNVRDRRMKVMGIGIFWERWIPLLWCDVEFYY